MIVSVNSARREQMIDISEKVFSAIREAGVVDGAVIVHCLHTTAAITINENADASVCDDLLEGLRRLAPQDAGWRHAEGNSDAHLKASLIGPNVLIPVEGGRPVLGTWQGVFFCEFDGPRRRQVFVSAI